MTTPSQKNQISSWVPVSLLTVTTAALTVPIFLFRKQRATLRAKSLHESPAPPRRAGVVSQQLLPTKSRTLLLDPKPVVVEAIAATTAPASATTGFFAGSPRLFAAKALGVATLLVMAGSVTAIWSVRSLLNVHNTQEFGDLARHTIRTKFPALTLRMHRPSDLTEVEGTLPRWIEVALNELEAEARVERLKRSNYSSSTDKNTPSA